MMVSRLKEIPKSWPPMLIAEFRAIPVTIPGSASGRTRKKEPASRPKKRKRWTAKAARLPSTRAIVVAPTPALIEVTKAVRNSLLFQGASNQRVERPVSGQDWGPSGLEVQ